MITLQEFCRYVDSLFRDIIITDYGPNGLQVEGSSKKVSKLVTAVSASLETIEAAAKAKADVLLVHHGMIWFKESQVISGVRKEKLRLLMENGITLLAYHLPLDAHQQFGNNWKAAQEMGWRKLVPFGAYQGTTIGVRGKLPKKISREAFKKQLENYYQHGAHCALGGRESVESVALISGGAHKSISEAIAAGVDCFITGSFDEPIWNEAYEGKINFFAMGHAATERVGPRALGEHLKAKFGVKHEFIGDENPF